ncbi:MAG: sporulation protein [Sphingomonas bacterium]|nr:sporulation protein [Sphingomonas bacterium]
MKTSLILGLGSTGLLMALGVSGCATANHPATLSSAVPKADRAAAKLARKADAAMTARKTGEAIALAEKAVTLSPRNAGFRWTLGQAYLKAGRFTSAEASFSDAVTLDPAAQSARFRLILSQIALGKWDAARASLATLEGVMPDADIGIATALAGDRERGIILLERAARADNAGSKARQNLALAYAMAGRWIEARTVAAQDVPADQLARRLNQWAKFAKPESSWDQVASLLGVTPAEDPGRPVALALAAPSPAVAAAAPMIDPAPAAAPVETAEVAPSAVAVPDGALVAPQVAEAEAPQLVLADPEVAPREVAVAEGPRVGRGKWVVQLGAYSASRSVDTAWSRYSGRYAAVRGYAPSLSTVVAKGASVHRLTLAGFARRSDAQRLCGRVKAAGGDCFVRAASGEQPIQIVSGKKGTSLAMR